MWVKKSITISADVESVFNQLSARRLLACRFSYVSTRTELLCEGVEKVRVPCLSAVTMTDVLSVRGMFADKAVSDL